MTPMPTNLGPVQRRHHEAAPLCTGHQGAQCRGMLGYVWEFRAVSYVTT